MGRDWERSSGVSPKCTGVNIGNPKCLHKFVEMNGIIIDTVPTHLRDLVVRQTVQVQPTFNRLICTQTDGVTMGSCLKSLLVVVFLANKEILCFEIP